MMGEVGGKEESNEEWDGKNFMKLVDKGSGNWKGEDRAFLWLELVPGKFPWVEAS